MKVFASVAARAAGFAIPTWLFWVAGVIAVSGAALAYRSHVWHDGFDTAVAERAARDALAVTGRLVSNATLAAKQESTNVKITKDKNEELAPVLSRIAAAPRLRVGDAICGPTATAKAEGAAGGDSADPPGRLVREDIGRDLDALKVAVEQDLATGRACQAFLLENGLVP